MRRHDYVCLETLFACLISGPHYRSSAWISQCKILSTISCDRCGHYESIAGKHNNSFSVVKHGFNKYPHTLRGTHLLLFTTLRDGSTNNNIAFRKTEVFLASAMYSWCTIQLRDFPENNRRAFCTQGLEYSRTCVQQAEASRLLLNVLPLEQWPQNLHSEWMKPFWQMSVQWHLDCILREHYSIV